MNSILPFHHRHSYFKWIYIFPYNIMVYVVFQTMKIITSQLRYKWLKSMGNIGNAKVFVLTNPKLWTGKKSLQSSKFDWIFLQFCGLVVQNSVHEIHCHHWIYWVHYLPCPVYCWNNQHFWSKGWPLIGPSIWQAIPQTAVPRSCQPDRGPLKDVVQSWLWPCEWQTRSFSASAPPRSHWPLTTWGRARADTRGIIGFVLVVAKSGQ